MGGEEDMGTARGAAGGTAGDLRGDAFCIFARLSSGLRSADAVALRLGRFMPALNSISTLIVRTVAPRTLLLLREASQMYDMRSADSKPRGLNTTCGGLRI